MPPLDETDRDVLLQIKSDLGQATNDLGRFSEALLQLAQHGKDTAEALKGLQRPTDESRTGFTRFQATLVSLDATLNLLGRGIRAVEAVLVGNARETANYAQQVTNLSQRVGLSIPFLQLFQDRLNRLGLDAGTSTQALQFFNAAVESARRGSGEFAATLQLLRVNLERGRPFEDILLETARALDQFADSQGRVTMARQLFSRGGATTVQALTDLARGLDQDVERAEALGDILDTIALDKGVKFARALRDQANASENLHKQLGAATFEALQPYVQLLTEGLSATTRFVREHRDGLAQLAKVLTVVTVAFGTLVAVVGGAAGITALLAALSAVTVGLPLVFGALAAVLTAGAAAWVLYGRSAKTAADEASEAAKRLQPLSLDRPMAAHAAGPPLALLPEQRQRVTEAWREVQAAEDAAAVAAVERARGRAAAIEEQRTREIAAEKKLYDETFKLERQQAIGNQLTLEQVDVLDQEHRARVAAINAKANADAKAATAEATQSLAALRIDSAEKTASSLLTIERTLNQARLATQQITEKKI